MVRTGWAAPQLGEFLAVLASAVDEQSAVDDALSGLVASFGADACVFLRDGSVTSSLGWPGRNANRELLDAVNNEQTGINLPGVGWCDTVAITVDREAHTTVLLARSGGRFTADEIGLLRGMARVLALGLRLLTSVAVERRQAAENQGLAVSLRDGQMLLERLAGIQRKIAIRESLPHILDAITAAVAELLDDDRVGLRLLDETDPAFTVIASSVGVALETAGDFWRLPLRVGVSGQAIVEARLCVAENYQDWDCAVAEFSHNGLYSAMAAPIQFEGRPVGSLAVASRREGRTYSERERNIVVAFAEHAGLTRTFQ